MTAPKRVKLGEIAEIMNGIPDARQIETANDESGITYKYIQPNHLGAFNDIQRTSEIRKKAPIDAGCLIRKNDILIKRLNPDTATVVGEDMPNTTFSSNLYVIRVFKGYHPAYIAGLIENRGASWINSNIVGSAAAIKSVSAKALAEMEIPAVEYEKQEAVGRMWLLHKKRRGLLGDMIIEDQRLMAAVINRITTRAKEGE